MNDILETLQTNLKCGVCGKPLHDNRDAEIERLRGRITQIQGQVAVADKGNWRDVIDNIGFIADGRFQPSVSDTPKIGEEK